MFTRKLTSILTGSWCGFIRRFAFPMLLFGIGLLTFGLLLPQLGFYWDDWAKIAIARLDGLSGYWAYYAEDRPLSAWTHLVFTPLLGMSPLAWQVFQWLLKLLTAWAAFWVGTMLWPKARRGVALGALLLLLYPSFTQHAAAVTFFQQWLQFALLLLSIGIMLHAAALPADSSRRARWGWTALALVLSALQLSVTEYFAPLELIRLPVLWLAAQRDGFRPRAAFNWALRRFAPYAALFAGYVAWRFFFMKLPGADPYSAQTLHALLTAPLPTLRALLPLVANDTLHILISVWSPLLWADLPAVLAPALLISLAVGAVCGAAAWVYFAWIEREDVSRTWPLQALLLGALAFLLGVAPAWATGRQVVFDAHSDRYALAALWGAGLLWAAAVEWLTPERFQRALLGTLLVMLAAGMQFRASNEYRWQWELQRRFYWQLTWRAPLLAKDTAIVTATEVFANQGLFSSSAALNLLYPQPPDAVPPAQGGTLAYWWYTLSPRYSVDKLPNPDDLVFKSQFRTLRFVGGSPNTLLLHYSQASSSCLWVLTPADVNNPDLSPLERAASNWSNPEVIGNEAPLGWTPPADMFGAEPAHDWCYFYQKADLARQRGDWYTVADLADEVLAAGYSPEDARSNAPREWEPFIEGYAHVGRWQQAARLTLQAETRGKQYQGSLMALWHRLEIDTLPSPTRIEVMEMVVNRLSQ